MSSSMLSMTMMASIYLFYLIVLLYPTDISGETVELEDYSQAKALTKCKNGLIANVDTFTINARITNVVKTLQNDKIVNILVEKSPDLSLLCILFFGETCEDTVVSTGCQCTSFKGGSFEIEIKHKAQLKWSEAFIFMSWTKTDDHKEREMNSRKVHLPIVYQEERASLFVGKTEVELSNCNVYFQTKDVPIIFCVYNLLTQTLTISLDYERTGSNKNCVMHFFDLDRSKSETFNLSYVEHEGCERHRAYTCRWQAPGDRNVLMSKNGGNTTDRMADGWIILMMMVCSHAMFEIFSLHFVMI